MNAVLLAAITALAAVVAVDAQTYARLDDAVAEESDSGPAPQVSTAKLREILAAGDAILLDARPVEEFAMSHIPGALNIAPKPGVPMSLYVSDVAEVRRLVPQKERLLVLYCNGPFCGKSRRLADELAAAGYQNLRRYQLGMPGWRIAGGVGAIEAGAIQRVATLDRTAVFVDAGLEPGRQPIPGMVRLAPDEITRAKDDGRLPLDHNTRIVVLGRSGVQARTLAERLAANAFQNVVFFDGNGARP